MLLLAMAAWTSRAARPSSAAMGEPMSCALGLGEEASLAVVNCSLPAADAPLAPVVSAAEALSSLPAGFGSVPAPD
jgi:hypothetical protein